MNNRIKYFLLILLLNLIYFNNSYAINCSYNFYDCADFSTQCEAQEILDYCWNDIHLLDEDKDWIACEFNSLCHNSDNITNNDNVLDELLENEDFARSYYEEMEREKDKEEAMYYYEQEQEQIVKEKNNRNLMIFFFFAFLIFYFFSINYKNK